MVEGVNYFSNGVVENQVEVISCIVFLGGYAYKYMPSLCSPSWLFFPECAGTELENLLTQTELMSTGLMILPRGYIEPPPWQMRITRNCHKIQILKGLSHSCLQHSLPMDPFISMT